MCSSDSGAHEGGVNAKPPVPWNKVFGKQTLPKLSKPMEEKAQRLWSPTWTTRTPLSGRPSIAAAVALSHSHCTDCSDLACRLWHTALLRPHMLVRDNAAVYLVLAQGRFAARAWPSVRCGNVWRFDTQAPWVWLFVDDPHRWFAVDFKWVPNDVDAGRFGFVAAMELSPHRVLVAVEALVHGGRGRLIDSDRKALCLGMLADFGPKKASQEDMEAMLLQRLVERHPLLPLHTSKLEDYRKRLRKQAEARKSKAEGSGDSTASEASGREPDVRACAMTAVALDGMDEGSAAEWRQDRRVRQLVGTQHARRLAQEMVRDARRAARSVGLEERMAIQRRARCSEPWARRFVLGADERGARVPEETR